FLRIPLDRGISPECIDLLRSLMTDAQHRLGAKDVNEIKNHPFFKGVQWSKLAQQKPPMIPEVESEVDTRNFDLFEEMPNDSDDEENIQQNQNQKDKDKDKEAISDDDDFEYIQQMDDSRDQDDMNEITGGGQQGNSNNKQNNNNDGSGSRFNKSGFRYESKNKKDPKDGQAWKDKQDDPSFAFYTYKRSDIAKTAQDAKHPELADILRMQEQENQASSPPRNTSSSNELKGSVNSNSSKTSTPRAPPKIQKLNLNLAQTSSRTKLNDTTTNKDDNMEKQHSQRGNTHNNNKEKDHYANKPHTSRDKTTKLERDTDKSHIQKDKEKDKSKDKENLREKERDRDREKYKEKEKEKELDKKQDKEKDKDKQKDKKEKK
ncbi:MAG: hypothetical protein EZS28_010707, partial [Streblomastix strix]